MSLTELRAEAGGGGEDDTGFILESWKDKGAADSAGKDKERDTAP